MKLSSHQGEYNRIRKHLRALQSPHSFSDHDKAARVSLQLFELRRIKRMLEVHCSGSVDRSSSVGSFSLPWKPTVEADKANTLGRSRIFAGIGRLFSGLFRRWIIRERKEG